MASSTEIVPSSESRPLVGPAAPTVEGTRPKAIWEEVPPRPHSNVDGASIRAALAAHESLLRESTAREAARLAQRPARGWWGRLFSALFCLPDPEPLDDEQMRRYYRCKKPGCYGRPERDRQLVKECLHHYNSINPGNEYEPAPGEVTQHYHMHDGTGWTHGNFVACQKRSGCFSFLPAPRTLFFFELVRKDGLNGVVTCTPLDEPVTEANSILGFPFGWSTRRSGRLDSICKTCYRRFDDVQHPAKGKILACRHSNAEAICKMCYLDSHVLHPYPGDFAFGYHDPPSLN